jgi:hypothetical protein
MGKPRKCRCGSFRKFIGLLEDIDQKVEYLIEKKEDFNSQDRRKN